MTPCLSWIVIVSIFVSFWVMTTMFLKGAEGNN